jgi:hypothetical protein
VLLVSCFLLFFQLGHYALWDDEAGLAIPSRGVWHTGDTTMVFGHNLVAQKDGIILRDLKDRANPPLPAFVMAPFAAFSGTGSLLPRIPFALSGLFCVMLLLYWLWKAQADSRAWLLMSLAILGNVSFFLYFRQARYYGLTLLCSVGVAYLYLRWNGSRRGLVGLSLLLLAILASHYMTFAALVAVLVLDYVFWQRKIRPLGIKDWLVLLGPLVAGGLLVVLIWNPFRTGIAKQAALNSLAQHFTLFFWNLRDLNRSEFAQGILLLLAPVLYFAGQKKPVLIRGAACILVYTLVMGMVSPQPVQFTAVADVRYLIPLIPLCMAVEVAVLQVLFRKAPLWAVATAGVVVFGTNLVQGGLWFKEGVRATPALYVRELINPPSDPYTVAANWINEHVKENESIWVQPDYMTYPLMYHAPKPTYAWQLTLPPRGQFANLPLIHFQGGALPDYIIDFGPNMEEANRLLQSWNWKFQGAKYQQIDTLDFYWRDLYRPELFWRAFTPVKNFNPQTDAIYVFKLVR